MWRDESMGKMILAELMKTFDEPFVQTELEEYKFSAPNQEIMKLLTKQKSFLCRVKQRLSFIFYES